MKWEDVTPEMATAYLDSMDGNRIVRQNRIDYYAAQMKAGLWRLTHQGIAFDSDGHLIDGQHRMWAIVESGVTVRLMVSRGVSPEDVPAIDGGLARNYGDVGHYAGWENTDPIAGTIAKGLVMGFGKNNRMVPPEVVQQWYAHYSTGCDFGVKVRNMTRGVGTKVIAVSVAGAFARAVYTIDEAVLLRIGEILKTGSVEMEADRAAIVLRDAWLTKRLGSSPLEQYQKTTSAIRAFVSRRTIRNLQRVETEIFPIPKLPPALKYDAGVRPVRRAAVEA